MHRFTAEPQRMTSGAELRQADSSGPRWNAGEKTESGARFPESSLVSLPQRQLPPAALPPASYCSDLLWGSEGCVRVCWVGDREWKWRSPI